MCTAWLVFSTDRAPEVFLVTVFSLRTEGVAVLVIIVQHILCQVMNVYYCPASHVFRFNITKGSISHTQKFILFYFTPSSWAVGWLSWAEMPGCWLHFLLSWVKWGRKKKGSLGGGGGQLETVVSLLGLETFPFLLHASCLASLCTFNNAFTVVLVAVCTFILCILEG